MNNMICQKCNGTKPPRHYYAFGEGLFKRLSIYKCKNCGRVYRREKSCEKVEKMKIFADKIICQILIFSAVLFITTSGFFTETKSEIELYIKAIVVLFVVCGIQLMLSCLMRAYEWELIDFKLDGD